MIAIVSWQSRNKDLRLMKRQSLMRLYHDTIGIIAVI